jgi:hypothetical protein
VAVKFIDGFKREVETLVVEVLTNVHMVQNRRVKVFRKQPMRSFKPATLW